MNKIDEYKKKKMNKKILSQRKQPRARKCSKCGKSFSMTAAEIKSHAKKCVPYAS
jgi:hypothetical protein